MKKRRAGATSNVVLPKRDFPLKATTYETEWEEAKNKVIPKPAAFPRESP